jgi:hypothetical protein
MSKSKSNAETLAAGTEAAVEAGRVVRARFQRAIRIRPMVFVSARERAFVGSGVVVTNVAVRASALGTSWAPGGR